MRLVSGFFAVCGLFVLHGVGGFRLRLHPDQRPFGGLVATGGALNSLGLAAGVDFCGEGAANAAIERIGQARGPEGAMRPRGGIVPVDALAAALRIKRRAERRRGAAGVFDVERFREFEILRVEGGRPR